MSQEKCFSLLAGVLLCLCQVSDTAITSWTVPPITGDIGSGSITVSEDQTTFFLFDDLNAVSDTSGSINCCSYTYVTQQVPFSVLTDGQIQITASLDYETQATYTIVVVAEDSAGAFGTATVTFNILDVNEATPVFSESLYNACVPDGSITDTLVTTVTATDQDTANTITYSISGGNGDFNIFSPSTGEIRVNNAITLDMSTTPTYSLTVVATDDGSPQLTGTSTVSVTVGDCDSAVSVYANVGMVTLAFSFTRLQFW